MSPQDEGLMAFGLFLLIICGGALVVGIIQTICEAIRDRKKKREFYNIDERSPK